MNAALRYPFDPDMEIVNDFKADGFLGEESVSIIRDFVCRGKRTLWKVGAGYARPKDVKMRDWNRFARNFLEFQGVSDPP